MEAQRTQRAERNGICVLCTSAAERCFDRLGQAPLILLHQALGGRIDFT
jgi:hypothetical protein